MADSRAPHGSKAVLMSSRLHAVCALLALLGAGLSGCTTGRYVEGVQLAAERAGVGDAASFAVSRRGHLRFDHATLSELDDVLRLDDLDAMKKSGSATLTTANAIATRAVDDELDRLPPKELDHLVDQYRLAEIPVEPHARRAALKAAYAERATALLKADQEHLAELPTVSAARRFLQEIRDAVAPPPGDRGKVARALLGAPLFLPAAIGAEIADAEATDRAVTADFTQIAVYNPPSTVAPPTAEELENAAPAQLAQWFAPVFVQQVDPAADYPPDDDRVGRVWLDGTPDVVAVHVDTTAPVVYWSHQVAKVEQRRYDQLVYVAWYPRHPAMSDNDPSAGNIDGVVVRLTLDRHHRPAVYEFVRSCGCYHTLWVAEFVEAAARAEYGPPTAAQQFAVQRTGTKRELFMPELVPDDGARPHRPIAYVSAGYHLLMRIHPLTDEDLAGEITREYTYQLRPYDELTRLPLGDGVASMFGSDGLVHDAGRREGWLLAPTGMLSAGQPRQLGTMKIRMDAYDYDDPRLLERNLRLPADF
nr:hypothetical protein [uncultured Ilyobacter sp.]